MASKMWAHTHTREDAVSSLFCAECVWLVDVIESLCVDVIVTVVLGLLAGELFQKFRSATYCYM